MLCVYSSHWYLAIICFPYLVGVKQSLAVPHTVTAKQQLKQVVMVVCSNVVYLSVDGAVAWVSRQVRMCDYIVKPVHSYLMQRQMSASLDRLFSTRPFICYRPCKHDLLPTNEPILLQIDQVVRGTRA